MRNILSIIKDTSLRAKRGNPGRVTPSVSCSPWIATPAARDDGFAGCRLNKILLILPMLWIIRPDAVLAANLQDVYDIARSQDPTLGSAEYLTYAVADEKDQQCRKLFPQLTAQASYLNYDQSDAGSILGDSTATTQGAIKGYQNTLSATLSQTIIDMPKFAECKAGGLKVNLQTAVFEVAREDLTHRVLQAYIAVLSARSRVKAANGAVDLYRSLWTEVQQGYAAKTEPLHKLDEATAKLAEARAAKIRADNDLANAQILMESLSAGKVRSRDLVDFKEQLPLATPSPADPLYWADVAAKNNLTLKASKLNEDVSHFTVKSAQSKHFPSLNAFGKHSEYMNNIERDTGSLPSDEDGFATDVFGATLTWKLFTGGSNTAGVSAAKNRYRAARGDYEAQLRDTRMQAQQAFGTVVSMGAGVNAAESLKIATQAKLKDMQNGMRAGTRTRTDLLDAKSKAIDAENKLDVARYDYVMSMIDFWKAVGALSSGSIQEVNRWLVMKP